eukprot:scaffold296_cov102-Amphora_coffeaeformis.AAC.34
MVYENRNSVWCVTAVVSRVNTTFNHGTHRSQWHSYYNTTAILQRSQANLLNNTTPILCDRKIAPTIPQDSDVGFPIQSSSRPRKFLYLLLLITNLDNESAQVSYGVTPLQTSRCRMGVEF